MPINLLKNNLYKLIDGICYIFIDNSSKWLYVDFTGLVL